MDQPTPQAPLDYLNSIASPPQTKTLSPVLLWGMIGGALLLIAVVIMLIFSLGDGSKPTLTTLAARLDALQTVADVAQGNLQTSELRSLNSSLTLVLTNANRDIAILLTDANIKLDEKNTQVKKVTAETTKLTSTLEDARLNGVYDRTYTREIIYYIKTLRNEMGALSSSTELKQFLQETDANLKPLQSSFTALNIA